MITANEVITLRDVTRAFSLSTTTTTQLTVDDQSIAERQLNLLSIINGNRNSIPVQTARFSRASVGLRDEKSIQVKAHIQRRCFVVCLNLTRHSSSPWHENVLRKSRHPFFRRAQSPDEMERRKRVSVIEKSVCRMSAQLSVQVTEKECRLSLTYGYMHSDQRWERLARSRLTIYSAGPVLVHAREREREHTRRET